MLSWEDGPMLKSEKKMAAMLLRWAADVFSNHGSNSMESAKELDKLFTPEEKAELLASYNRYIVVYYNDKNAASERLDYSMDWSWMELLADKLEEEANEQ